MRMRIPQKQDYCAVVALTNFEDCKMTTIEVTRNGSPSKKLVIGTVRPRQFLDSLKKTIFVVGSALVIFAAARNSVTWHLQRFWGASGNFWEKRWQDIYDSFDGNHHNLGVWGTNLLALVVFWFFNLFFFVIDLFGKPECLLKYKIQQDRNVPVDREKFKAALKQVLFNQTVVNVPLSYVWAHLLIWRGMKFDASDLPAFHWVLFELTIFILVEEFMFYYSHRLFHSPQLYKRFHKKHHEWTAPIGIISIYAHPLEHLISNMLPILMGPLIFGSHLGTAWLWITMAILSTIVSHCGYHLPLLPSPEAHDFHHLKFTNNFGVLGVLDRLHGTDENFRASKAYQRHIMLFGFIPLSQQIPDDSKHLKEKSQ